MKKRFIIFIEDSTKEQNDSLLDWIRSENIGWWHWFQGSWLLSNARGHLSASVIRDKLKQIYGTSNTFVIELNNGGDTWSGYGPDTDQKNMFTWIKKNWSSD